MRTRTFRIIKVPSGERRTFCSFGKDTPKSVAAEWGYDYSQSPLTLPLDHAPLPRLERLREDLEMGVDYSQSKNEQAVREMVVAPVVRELIYCTHVNVYHEYWIWGFSGKGNVDYLLKSSHGTRLIIEAKAIKDCRIQDQSNPSLLKSAISQLMAELITLDQRSSRAVQSLSVILGVVTTGMFWQFVQLDRVEKQIIEDTKIYTTPEDLETVLRILIAALR